MKPVLDGGSGPGSDPHRDARPGLRSTLLLWPNASALTGKRAVRVGMGSPGAKPAPPPAAPERQPAQPAIVERDAAVNAIVDDLRSIRKRTRRAIDTEDPFR